VLDVSIRSVTVWAVPKRTPASLLHADPTHSALQVFLPKSGLSVTEVDGLPNENDSEDGMWINADPIPGCIVCNIGESKSGRKAIFRVIHLPMLSVGDMDKWGV